MNTRTELRFVRQKEGNTLLGSDGQPMVLTKKVLQFREVYEYWSDGTPKLTSEWQTVPFDESVVLEPEDNKQ